MSVFVSANIDTFLASMIRRAGHGSSTLPAPSAAADADAGWDHGPWSADAQRADAEAFRASITGSEPAWIVVDHYNLDERWERIVRGRARVLVLDDLANRTHDCDLLLDHTYGRDAANYRDLAPAHCRVLTGPLYSPMRPEFAAERHASLERRAKDPRLRRLLVSLGGTDLRGVTERVVDAILPVRGIEALDVVVGVSAPSLTAIERLAMQDDRLALHIDTNRMAELMRDADVAIGAAGTTSWERCCLGLPSITLVIADNQRTVAANLEEAGASVTAKVIEDVPALLDQLLADPQRLETMVAATAPICDGQGALRLAEFMLGHAPAAPRVLSVTPRPAVLEDARLPRNGFFSAAGA